MFLNWNFAGVRLNSLLGRKGSLEKMNSYWDVGQFFSVSMLANDVGKAVQAAEKLFKLKPPVWYVGEGCSSITQLWEMLVKKIM